MTYERRIFVSTLIFLAFLFLVWRDKLYVKCSGFLSEEIEVIKFVFITTIAFKIAKYCVSRFKSNKLFSKFSNKSKFLLFFFLFNSYISIQYVSRVVSHRLIKNEMREHLYNKTDKLGPAGWGFQCDSLTIKEFKEITKQSKILNLPKNAHSIYVYDWYEIDFRRTVEFNVPASFNIHEYYENNSTILKNIKEIKYNDYVSRTTFNVNGRISDAKQIKFDTLKFKRYRYNVSDN